MAREPVRLTRGSASHSGVAVMPTACSAPLTRPQLGLKT